MFFNIHTHHLSKCRETIELYNQYPSLLNLEANLFSIGIHPIYIKEKSIDKEINIIKQKISSKKCLAIGEIGLDKLCDIDFNVQIHVFELQLKIAEEHKIPVIIHCVRAYQEVLYLHKKMNLSIPFIFHGFNKNEQLAQQIISQNCLLSFGNNLLTNKNLQMLFKELSWDKFFLENDASNVSIQDIYTFASNLREISIKELQLQQAENWKTIFGYEVK